MSDTQQEGETVTVPKDQWDMMVDFVASQKAAAQTQNKNPGEGLALKDRMEEAANASVVWVENMSTAASRFKHKDQGFYLEAHGYVGSVQQIPAELSTLPYVQRAIQRGLLKVVKDSTQAWERLDQLIMPAESGQLERDVILDAMTEGFEDRTDHRYKKDLPEFGVEGAGWTPEEIHGMDGRKSQTIADGFDAPTEALGPQPEFVKDFKPIDGPVSPEEALEATEHG